ncbi:transposase family protein, partial [Candidatus Parcubacteria bacterium]
MTERFDSFEQRTWRLDPDADPFGTTYAYMVVDLDRLPLYGQGGLFEILEGFPDTRKRRGLRHSIESILAISLCAVLAGARSFVAIAEWGADQSPRRLRRLGSRRGKPPSERTIRRVLESIDVEGLDRRTGRWMAERQRIVAGVGLALDGETVRGSRDGRQDALHLLSAIVHDSGTV